MIPRDPLTSLADDLEAVVDHAGGAFQALRGARIFITGGTGFFGRWLLSSLIHANRRLNLDLHAVVLSRDPVAFTLATPALAGASEITLWAGDVASFTPPPGGFTHVLHAATDATTAAAERPRVWFRSIVEGTARVLDFAEAAGVQSALLTSSGGIYGSQPADMTHIPETWGGAPDPLSPGSTYATAKRAAEHLASLSRVPVAVARCFAFVGPYLPLDTHFAIGNFIGDALAGRDILIKGDGSPLRSYLYAGDLAAWLWTLLVRGQAATAYNVGSDEAVTLVDLAERVKTVVSPEGRVSVLGKPEGGPRHRYVPSIERAKDLGLAVWTPLDDAIARTAAWHRSA